MKSISRKRSQTLRDQHVDHDNDVSIKEITTNRRALLSVFKRVSKQFRKVDSDLSTSSDHTTTTETERCVSFCEKVVVHRVMPLSSFSAEEVKACWFSEEESRQLKKSNLKQIRLLNEGKQFRDKKYCSRGLEGSTNIGVKARQLNRQLACNAVLDIQARQLRDGVFDDDAIAAVYKRASSGCQLWAKVVGNRDQQAARAYLEA